MEGGENWQHGRGKRTVIVQSVGEAYVECGVGVRGKSVSVLAVDVLGTAIIVAHCVADLCALHVSISMSLHLPSPIHILKPTHPTIALQLQANLATYMHIQRLSIPPIPANNRRHNHQLVLCNKVLDASFVFRGIVGLYGVDVEFQRRSKR